MKFPSHLIPNEQKDYKWILQYCKAIWKGQSEASNSIFYGSRTKYDQIKQYALGNQSINKYKPLLGVDDTTNETWLNIDWSIVPVVPRFRRMALSKVKKLDYNIVANPIDPMSKDEKNKYVNDLKKKVIRRDQMNQMAGFVPVQEANVPKDIEEVDRVHALKYKHKVAMEMEQVIEVMLDTNKYHELRNQIKEDLFDYGVGVLKDSLDSNGRVKLRRVNPANLVTNYCQKRDFSDIEYAAEVLEMTISDLRQEAGDAFTDDDYRKIGELVRSKFGNSVAMAGLVNRKELDHIKVQVVDVEFFSYNTITQEERVDKRGNRVVRKAGSKQRKSNKYHTNAYKVVYKGKWVVGTDYIYDYGLQTDMKRSKNNLTDCTLSFHLFAPDFYQMKAYGMMEQIIPLADQIQISWYKLQNAIAEARPKGIMIEMSALEDIPLGAGGKQLTPTEVLDLYGSKGVLVYRKVDIAGRATNYRPIEELNNGIGQDVMTYYQIIQQNIQMIREITGLNEYTDGSSPDPRALKNVTQMAQEATNNSLYNVVEGDRMLLQSVAQSLLIRVEDAVEFGSIDKYASALGEETIDFLKKQSNLKSREFGIVIEDRPTDMQKERLQQLVQAYLGQDMLDITDSLEIENATNYKMAQELLAYRVDKRKKEKMEEAQMQQQQQAQMQSQVAQQTEQAKQQTLQAQFQMDSQMEQLKAQLEMQIQEQKYQFEMQIEMLKQGVKNEINDKNLAANKEVQQMNIDHSKEQAQGQPQQEGQPSANPMEAMMAKEAQATNNGGTDAIASPM